MHKRATGHVRYIIWIFILVALLGILIDELAWVLAISFGVYTVWTLRQAFRLHNWLYKRNRDNGVPESYGLWGDLFEGIYYSQQQNQKVRQRLTKMIERVRSSANALKDAVVMTNDIGQMDWWNEAASRMFHFDPDKDQAQLITNLVRDPEFKAYFEAKDYEHALELRSPSDANTILQIHITLFGENERLILARDVTRLHHLEQMRKDFVSNVSHEMRTPLTVLRGYVETMIDSEDTPKRWNRALVSMESQTQRLETLVSDLLLLEKYETKDGRTKEQPVDMQALISSVCRDAEMLSAEDSHDIQFMSETHAGLVGIENQLRSAISNLVFNAVKYTPANGKISIKWWQDHSGCHLSVEDTGCGFDPVHIPRITERFYRADPSRHANTGGSGLGLAIVKHVLLNHGATLEVHSAVDQGSQFICHFPNARVVEPERLSSRESA